MSKIEINNVYKIFGSNPKSILPMVKDGASKEEILDKTGHTVGLDNVTLKIVQEKINDQMKKKVNSAATCSKLKRRKVR